MNMTKFNVATSEQKKALCAILTGYLMALDLLPHYQVFVTRDFCGIRQKNSNPPTHSQKKRFNTLMLVLAATQWFEYKVADALLGVGGMFAAYNNCIIITKINTNKLDSLLEGKKPEDMDEKTWIALPTEIKRNWDELTKEMREYIQKCLAEDLQKKYSELFQTVHLGETYRSPIGYTFPNIPVRLPNPLLEGGKSKEVYDLIEILKLEVVGAKQRRNPITKQPFTLKEVLPDPDGLKALKERLETADKNKEKSEQTAAQKEATQQTEAVAQQEVVELKKNNKSAP